MTSVPPSSAVLSVVVPTCDRNDQLAQCLERLAPGRQTLETGRYEVVVTDDGARDTAQDLVRTRFEWAKWVAGPGRGPAANRNNGVRFASGEWIAFVDDDCLPEPGWLAAFDGESRKPQTLILEGMTVCPDKTDNPFEEHVENLHGGALWSCNFAIRRSVFDQVSGFDEGFTEACFEDIDLHWRLRRAGWAVSFCPDARVLHPARAGTWRDLWRRTLRLRWMVRFRLKTGVATSLWRDMFVYYLRITVRTVKHWRWDRWKTQVFTVFWQWLTFPVLLPYLLLWQRRFSRQLERR
jgi:GT2 family glycosyltransferase